MHLILTHEQADFDALGAMLGAFLMNEDAYPVLPRRMNRNCRAFLTLYGAELPFVEAVDLPNQAVETITLVDTQSLATLKGMSRRTRIQVVDHHNPRPDLPSEWDVRTEISGACTTLFVEGLREHDGALAPLYATLLLLGIYEDTGSLLYATTQARDARAAGYLLEQGASLQLAARSLNPPLSAEQRMVCDRLLASAETVIIQHLPVVVAAADGQDLNDEVSSIAHKLRDLLDPAGLFLLVHTREGIRLVARSTDDRVDAAGVAAHFGGGGHTRAAAALVRLPSPLAAGPDPLVAVRAELMTLLPRYVQPAVTMHMIMSRHPQVISPETTLQDALQRMQRYGHEGFPVVVGQRIVGLLTRRAVDRASAHKLNLTAGSLMDAGEVFVPPDASVDQLRTVMTQSGWGQVPVYDAQAGKVVGIVTRTDLLKQLGDRPGVALNSSLAHKLDAALPILRLRLLQTVAAEASAHHLAIYIVGGFVRDLILGRPGLDFDIVVEGDAIALAHLLQKRLGGHVVAHSRFGTAKWSIAQVRAELAQVLAAQTPGADLSKLDAAIDELPDTMDLISARTEFYEYPTALPTVERSSIKLDLHRRDFTINTLALRLDGRHYGDLYDYWGGTRDLRDGCVRVLHSLSFVDDPTRQLRAVRFEQRFGFTIERRTLQLMQEGIPMIRQVSGERLRHELDLVLQEDRAAAMLERLAELGLLRAIHPDLPAPSPHLEAVFSQILCQDAPPEWNLPRTVGHLPLKTALAYIVWLTELAREQVLAVADQIRLPGALLEALLDACALRLELSDPDENKGGAIGLARLVPSQLVQRLDAVSLPAIFALFLCSPDGPGRALLRDYGVRLRKTWPFTSGALLRGRGVVPGPVYKQILSALRSAWLDGVVTSQSQEMALLEELLIAYG